MRRLRATVRTVTFVGVALTGAALTVLGGVRQAPSALATPVVSPGRGALRLDDSRPGTAVLSGTNLRPGQAVSGSVAITARGMAADLSLMLTDLVEDVGPYGGRLSALLRLQVLESPPRGLPHIVYDGPLRSLATRALGTFRAGETRRYRFVAWLPDTRAAATAQGSRATASFRWAAEQHAPGAGRHAVRQAPLRLRLILPVAQRAHLHAGAVVGWATCSRPCRLTVAAHALPHLGLRPTAPAQAAGRHRTRLVLRLSPTARRALRRHRALRAAITVTATDGHGAVLRARGRTRVHP